MNDEEFVRDMDYSDCEDFDDNFHSDDEEEYEVERQLDNISRARDMRQSLR